MTWTRRQHGWLSQLTVTTDDGETVGGIIDYRLTRRSLVNEFRRGRISREQLCDAHPDLVRAANNFGDLTDVRCPICAQDNVRLVTYVFGPRLPRHGRCITKVTELEEFRRLAQDSARVASSDLPPSVQTYTAYIVECCAVCRWHHLVRLLPMATPQLQSKLAKRHSSSN